MNNNDILRRFRYALDIKDTVMVQAFRLSGYEIDRDGVKNFLKKRWRRGAGQVQ